MNILFIDQCDIFSRAIVTFEDLHIILLNLAGLFHNMLIWIRQIVFKKPLPLGISELISI